MGTKTKIALGSVVALFVIGGIASSAEDEAPDEVTSAQENVDRKEQPKRDKSKAPKSSAPESEEPEPEPEPEPQVSAGEENALRSAESYLDYTAFSKSGLAKQLKFEGYTESEAQYAVNNIDADWNEQAVASAKSYLEYTSFSRSGLIQQLKFEGFTQEQAEFGVNGAGL